MLTKQEAGAQTMSIIGKLRNAAQTLREAIKLDYFTPWAMDAARTRAHGAEAARLRAGMTPEAYYRQQADPELYVSRDGAEYKPDADPFGPDAVLDAGEWHEPDDASGEWRAGPMEEYPTVQAWADAQFSDAEIDAIQAEQERAEEAAREDPESYSDFWAYQPTPAHYIASLSDDEWTAEQRQAARDEYDYLSDDARARYLGDRAAEMSAADGDRAAAITTRMVIDGVRPDDQIQVCQTAYDWEKTMRARPSEPEQAGRSAGEPTAEQFRRHRSGAAPRDEAEREEFSEWPGLDEDVRQDYAEMQAREREAEEGLDGYEGAQTVEEAAAFAGMDPAELDDQEAENGPAHVDQGHEPGTLYGCDGCESGPCAHPEGDGDEWCVSDEHQERQVEAAEEEAALDPENADQVELNAPDNRTDPDVGFLAAPVAQKEAGA